jgi:hypothetical protein
MKVEVIRENNNNAKMGFFELFIIWNDIQYEVVGK